MIYDKKIQIQAPVYEKKYDLIDSHLHFLDFTQDSDGFPALTYGEGIHMDSKAFKGIYDLAADYDLPVLVHHNISAQNNNTPLYVEELMAALEHNRKTKIIWAHVGISRRIELEELLIIAGRLLHDNPNLYVDISWIVFDHYIRGDNMPYNEDHALMDMWVVLMEKYPERFLIGSDKVGHWETYPSEIMKYNALIDRLKPETARKICRENVLSLIKNY